MGTVLLFMSTCYTNRLKQVRTLDLIGHMKTPPVLDSGRLPRLLMALSGAEAASKTEPGLQEA